MTSQEELQGEYETTYSYKQPEESRADTSNVLQAQPEHRQYSGVKFGITQDQHRGANWRKG